MVTIAPFRALRYAPETDLAAATSPPHDCIPPAQAGALRAEATNIIHVVLPASRADDGDGPGPPSKYARAAATLAEWTKAGIMRRDARPVLYYHQVTWRPDGGEARTMNALVARLRLDPAHKEVHPHERTLQRPRKDRLILRQAAETDVEPIWLLYRDERGWVDEILSSNAFEELARFTDEEGHEHRLWRIDRTQAVEEVVAQFDGRHLVIADGHHRYRTALEHHALTGRDEHGSILVGLVRDNDPGLRIEATHRLVSGLAFADVRAAVEAASASWDAMPIDLPVPTSSGTLEAAVAPLADGETIVVVGRVGSHLQGFALRLRSDVPQPATRLASLAVSRLHERLLRDHWGVPLERPEGHVRYARDAEHAIAEVAAGSSQVAILLPPEPVSAVLDVAMAGQLMPQKATYFVPKLRSGVVLSPLDEPLPRPWQELAGDPGPAQFRRPPLL